MSHVFDKGTSVEVLYNDIVRKYSSLPEPVERDGKGWTALDRPFSSNGGKYKASKVNCFKAIHSDAWISLLRVLFPALYVGTR